MDLKFKLEMMKIELEERVKNYSMNKQIQKKLYMSDDDMTQISYEIADLIKNNNLFQPSIITDLIGRWNFDRITICPHELDLKQNFPYDFLEMKKKGIANFRLIGSRTKSNDEIIWFYKNENNNLDNKIYTLSGEYEYYEKKYNEFYEKNHATLKLLEECTHVRYYFYNRGGCQKVYRLPKEVKENQVLMYATEFVYTYNNKCKTKKRS